MSLIVVAIGGNALRTEDGLGAPSEWFDALTQSLPPLVELVAEGHRLVLTHGNGPQVGEELLRMEIAKSVMPALTLDLCVAETEGSIGYAIQQVMGNLLGKRGLAARVASVVTQVVVDRSDQAFANPTKPIGAFYRKAEALRHAREHGWSVVEDSGRGWRRVVPSPRPVRVVETPLIRTLVDAGMIPVAVGGGGIPVFETPRGFRGAEAVIEKALATAVLAGELSADRVFFLTGVDRVAVGYGTPAQRFLDRLTVTEARRLLAAGEFPPGSMGPKVEAAVQFVEAGGRAAVITSLDRMAEATRGTGGTIIQRETA
ncbi:MAG: carbamate kinase [Candidatus Rokubacteria bacterium 13_1_40CM_4_69_5]|nr:MAG: carbamate kinase [Candidatus Rokubacteria bacterium 13_1_40CM_4_69_5]